LLAGSLVRQGLCIVHVLSVESVKYSFSLMLGHRTLSREEVSAAVAVASDGRRERSPNSIYSAATDRSECTPVSRSPPAPPSIHSLAFAFSSHTK
jgi:hypothetical protein